MHKHRPTEASSIETESRWALTLEIRKARSQAKQPRSMRVSKKRLRDPDFLDRMIRATMCELGDPRGDKITGISSQ